MTLTQIRYRTEQLKGQRQQLAADIDATTQHIAQLKQEAVHAEEARAIIQTVAQETQKQLEYHVSEIVSLALASVFDSPYTLRLIFVQRRNKTEADIVFERDGEQFRPIDAAGGGAVDVAAFALRVAMWSLRRPRSRNILILDEPFKMLSRDLMPKAAVMIGEVSKKLGLQIIMVSHSTELIEGADRYFEVETRKGRSHVKEGNKENNGNDAGETNQDTDNTKRRLLPAQGRDADIQDIGNPSDEQPSMDGVAAPRRATRTRRSKSLAPADNEKRPRGVETDGAPRRRT